MTAAPPGPAALALGLSLDDFAIGGRLFEVVTAALLALWLVLVLVRRR